MSVLTAAKNVPRVPRVSFAWNAVSVGAVSAVKVTTAPSAGYVRAVWTRYAIAETDAQTVRLFVRIAVKNVKTALTISFAETAESAGDDPYTIRQLDGENGRTPPG